MVKFIILFLFLEKDVSRTDRTMNFYAEDNNRNLEQLRDILMTYVMYNFDLGYVQGMSDILSPIFFLIQDEVDSFWCFAAAVDRMVCFFCQVKHFYTIYF